MFDARPYQHRIIDHITEHARCGVFAGMGMGKTVSTLTAIDILRGMEGIGPVLVLAPYRVAASTWPDEARKWPHLSLSVSPVVGNATQRAAALSVPADIYTTNYETVPWLVERLGENWPFGMIVADESTRLKSHRLRGGGKRAKALAQVAYLSERFVLLTGTPAPNGLHDLWGQLWFLDRGQRLGRTFQSFESRWFRRVQKGASAFAAELVPLQSAQAEIQAAIRDVCLTVEAKDYFDLRDPVEVIVPVALPDKARATYDQLRADLYAELTGGEVFADSGAALTIKCLQFANGALYLGDDGAFEAVHDAKLDALESIIEEAAGAPVLCAYHFKSDATRIRTRFPSARMLDKDPQTIRDWNAGRIPLLLAHPESAGHGLNLQDGGNILAVFGHWWALEPYQQIVERIGPTRQIQAGHDRPVFIYQIVATDTLDELVIRRRKTKSDIQSLLMDALK